MHLIDYDKMREIIKNGLETHLKVPVIRGNQTAKQPDYPFVSYNITTIAGANNGTWQQHEDGIDRKLVRSIWSFSVLAQSWNKSVSLANKTREWIDRAGRLILSDNGITVQSIGEITNRDNILTVEYECKNGFDVVFYVYDETANTIEQSSYIESAETIRTE